MVEEEEVTEGVLVFRIGLDPVGLVWAHSQDMCPAWWHLKQTPCFMCLSLSSRDILTWSRHLPLRSDHSRWVECTTIHFLGV